MLCVLGRGALTNSGEHLYLLCWSFLWPLLQVLENTFIYAKMWKLQDTSSSLGEGFRAVSLPQVVGGNFTAFLLQHLLGWFFFYPFLIQSQFLAKITCQYHVSTSVIIFFFFFPVLRSRLRSVVQIKPFRCFCHAYLHVFSMENCQVDQLEHNSLLARKQKPVFCKWPQLQNFIFLVSHIWLWRRLHSQTWYISHLAHAQYYSQGVKPPGWLLHTPISVKQHWKTLGTNHLPISG